MKDFSIKLGQFILIIGVIFGLAWFIYNYLPRKWEENRTKANEHAAQERRERLQTLEHDGHQFVVQIGYQKAAILHHPSCKCLQAK